MDKPKQKYRSVRRKKRKFYGNRFTLPQGKDAASNTEEKDILQPPMNVVSDDDLRPVTPSSADENMEANEVPLETPKARKTGSASARKLTQYFKPDSESMSSSDESDHSEELTTSGLRFIDLSQLSCLTEMLLCPNCKTPNVKLEEDQFSKMGFASTIKVYCSYKNCDFGTQFYTSNRTGHSFDVNKRAVLAARNIGVGYQGLRKFAAAMNMPAPMTKKAYATTVKTLKDAAERVAQKSMSNSVPETTDYYEVADDGIFDIAVSGDGTWRKRGYKSAYGIVAVMSTMTGKVLDIEIMSKECKSCAMNIKKSGTIEFDEWWEGHQHECHANFEGSSGAMEAAGCLAIFQRSVEKHTLRYTEFLGDGDSKAYDQLTAEKVYGENVTVKKLECVGHIQKRMGSRLRSLKKRLGKTKLADGKTAGGKGRLTDKLIDNLQVYYGKAIRNNTSSISEMHDAVMATYYHSISTDDEPQHDLCPEGKDSWCGFKRSIADNSAVYKHQHPIPNAIAQEIKPVFEALSTEHLLSCCLHGGTQNQNEAFNALIWQRATKQTHSSLPTVELAAYLAVGHYNDGAQMLVDTIEELGIEPGAHCEAAARKLDKERIYHPDKKNTKEAKKRRRTIRSRKKGYAEELEEREGPQYESGAF